MKSLHILTHSAPFKIPPNIGDLLGYGFHGEVYELKNDPNKVIKLGAYYIEEGNKVYNNKDDQYLLTTHDSSSYKDVGHIYRFIKDHPQPQLATVFDYQPLYSGINPDDEWKRHILIYSATIEKLLPLTEDENKVFKTVCKSYNANIPSKTIPYLDELKNWFAFDYNKVHQFYMALPVLPIHHHDFHRRNIMKDQDGNFKLIDFELLEIKENNNGKDQFSHLQQVS